MYRLLIIWFLCILYNLPVLATADSIRVYVFLLEKCVVCTGTVPAIHEIYEEFADKGVDFVGIFPNPRITTEQGMDSFSRVHELPFPVIQDAGGMLTQRLNATVTPEVVVLHEWTGDILYRGKIDNLYERVGQRRQMVTEHYLKEALRAILDRKEITVKETTPVGCFIMQ